MNSSDMAVLYETVKIRKIALELTDSALAVYLVKNKGYVPYLLGSEEDIFIGKRYLKDVLDLEVSEVVKAAEGSLGDKTSLFYFSDEYCDRVKALNASVTVNLYQAVRESIKKEFYLYFWKNKDSLIEGIQRFEDDISRKTYLEFVRSYLQGDNYNGPLYDEKDKYFDIYEEFSGSVFGSEGWINLGSCRGDTVIWALLRKLKFKKVYCIEADSEQFNVLKNNIALTGEFEESDITLIQGRCGQGEGCFALDDLSVNEEIGLINMDIEGDEADVLLSAKEMIRRYHPILAVCAYHKPDDLLTIPRIISAIDDRYTFVLRKYLSGTGRHYNGVHRTNELVLYAVSQPLL